MVHHYLEDHPGYTRDEVPPIRRRFLPFVDEWYDGDDWAEQHKDDVERIFSRLHHEVASTVSLGAAHRLDIRDFAQYLQRTLTTPETSPAYASDTTTDRTPHPPRGAHPPAPVRAHPPPPPRPR